MEEFFQEYLYFLNEWFEERPYLCYPQEVPYYFSKFGEMIYIFDNMENIGRALRSSELFDELMDIFRLNSICISQMYRYKPYFPPVIMKLIDSISDFQHIQEMFEYFGDALLNTDMRVEFIKFLLRYGFFSGDNLWKHMDLLKEIFTEKIAGMREQVAMVLSRRLREELEKGTDPMIFSPIIGDIAGDLALEIHRIGGSESLDLLPELVVSSDDREDALSKLFHLSDDSTWLYVALKLTHEGRMSRDEMEYMVRNFLRVDSSKVIDTLRARIMGENDEKLRNKEIELYRDIFWDSPKSHIPHPYPQPWTT